MIKIESDKCLYWNIFSKNNLYREYRNKLCKTLITEAAENKKKKCYYKEFKYQSENINAIDIRNYKIFQTQSCCNQITCMYNGQNYIQVIFT